MRSIWFTLLAVVGALVVVAGALYGGLVYKYHESATQAIRPVLPIWRPTYGVKAGGPNRLEVIRLVNCALALSNRVSNSPTLNASGLQSLGSSNPTEAGRAWNIYRNNLEPYLTDQLLLMQQNLPAARPYLANPDALADDIRNMQLLLRVADVKQGTVGLEALRLFIQATQDVQYYLLGKGDTPPGVTEIQGSRRLDDFLAPYLKQLA
ncbi:MAG: hypothetical protein IRZ10_10215 [Thermoflavifilum sp.]|nr:hypothetical protein [Thermoflavifilum sp.]MCL6514782.1 hypothetical protein [Alicyclobacillus sp.]